MGPGMWTVDAEVVSWAKVVVRRARMVSVNFMAAAKVDGLVVDVGVEAQADLKKLWKRVNSEEGVVWAVENYVWYVVVIYFST